VVHVITLSQIIVLLAAAQGQILAFGHDLCLWIKQLLLLSAVGRTCFILRRYLVFLEQLLLQNSGLKHSYWGLITSYSINTWSLHLELVIILPLLRSRLVVAGRAAKVSEIDGELVAIILQDHWLLDGACVVSKHISILSGISLSVQNMWEVVIGVKAARVHAVILILSGPGEVVGHADFVVLHRDGAGQLLEGLEAQQRLATVGAIVEATTT